ncbi:ankyrin repeat domain-containing protein [Verrucomicrobiaceae bacterium 227]
MIRERGVPVSGSALFAALDQNDAVLAEALLISEVSPSCRDSLKRTPLMAAAGGTPSLISSILEAGADSEDLDANGWTALWHAVEGNCLEAMVDLLAGGADPGISVAGTPLVTRALEQGKVAAVFLLLDAGASPVSEGKKAGPLARLAVEKGHLLVLKELARRGIDFKGESEALLHLAMEREHIEVLEFLLESGMDPAGKNESGESLLHAAIGASRAHLVPLLIQHGVAIDELNPQGWTPLQLAILARDSDLLQVLLDHGADLEKLSACEGEARSALSLAIENELHAMARVLLQYGAHPRDELYVAVQRGGQAGREIVKLLLENGASAAPSRAPLLDTPLGWAVRHGDYPVAKMLLDAGAPHESKDPCGQKPFHIAIARGDAEMVGLLLDLGADPNEPFHPEIDESFLSLVKSEGIARWALRNSNEITPIMVAADSGNIEVARQLMARGAKAGRSTKVKAIRMWPLTFATRQGDTEMIQVVLGRKPGKSRLWIRVDLSKQRAYVFDGDKEVLNTRVSTGKAGYRTRTGEFVITNKYRDWKSTIYESSMPYFQRLSASDFGFHVGHVPSYAASHGCIRMSPSAARKLFGMTRVGDYVEIVP